MVTNPINSGGSTRDMTGLNVRGGPHLATCRGAHVETPHQCTSVVAWLARARSSRSAMFEDQHEPQGTPSSEWNRTMTRSEACGGGERERTELVERPMNPLTLHWQCALDVFAKGDLLASESQPGDGEVEVEVEYDPELGSNSAGNRGGCWRMTTSVRPSPCSPACADLRDTRTKLPGDAARGAGPPGLQPRGELRSRSRAGA